MRILGIDYGSKNVGIAVGDTDHKMAFPKVVLKNTKQLMEEVVALCKEEKVEKIILGESRNFKGEENKIMEGERGAHAFRQALQLETGLPVELHPEFMTSAEAEHLQGKTPMLDASAAAIILKSYLEKI